jgi:hypothetical protein
MPHGDVETYHFEDQWHNRIEGTTDILGSYYKKVHAVAAGREEARERQVEHIVRKEDGTIEERQTYGHDPRNISG